MKQRFLKFIKQLFLDLLDLVFPRCCECCGTRLTTSEKYLCAACFAWLPRRKDMLTPMDNPTVRLLWGRMMIERGASWVDYVPHSPFANVIYRIKYGDCPGLASYLGKVVAREMSPHGFFDGIDMIIPLPLHPARQRKRGYNQSCEFALGINSVLQIPVAEGIIVRTRNTKSQTLMTSTQRASNMIGAFAVARPEELKGKHVLLVDDILTTGASLGSCIDVLAKVADVRVSFLTIGKTHD